MVQLLRQRSPVSSSSSAAAASSSSTSNASSPFDPSSTSNKNMPMDDHGTSSSSDRGRRASRGRSRHATNNNNNNNNKMTRKRTTKRTKAGLGGWAPVGRVVVVTYCLSGLVVLTVFATLFWTGGMNEDRDSQHLYGGAEEEKGEHLRRLLRIRSWILPSSWPFYSTSTSTIQAAAAAAAAARPPPDYSQLPLCINNYNNMPELWRPPLVRNNQQGGWARLFSTGVDEQETAGGEAARAPTPWTEDETEAAQHAWQRALDEMTTYYQTEMTRDEVIHFQPEGLNSLWDMVLMTGGGGGGGGEEGGSTTTTTTTTAFHQQALRAARDMFVLSATPFLDFYVDQEEERKGHIRNEEKYHDGIDNKRYSTTDDDDIVLLSTTTNDEDQDHSGEEDYDEDEDEPSQEEQGNHDRHRQDHGGGKWGDADEDVAKDNEDDDDRSARKDKRPEDDDDAVAHSDMRRKLMGNSNSNNVRRRLMENNISNGNNNNNNNNNNGETKSNVRRRKLIQIPVGPPQYYDGCQDQTLKMKMVIYGHSIVTEMGGLETVRQHDLDLQRAYHAVLAATREMMDDCGSLDRLLQLNITSDLFDNSEEDANVLSKYITKAMTLVELQTIPELEFSTGNRQSDWFIANLWKYVSSTYKLQYARNHPRHYRDRDTLDHAWSAIQIAHLPSGFGRHHSRRLNGAEDDTPSSQHQDHVYQYLRENLYYAMEHGQIDLVSQFVDLIRSYGCTEENDYQLRDGTRFVLNKFYGEQGGRWIYHQPNNENDDHEDEASSASASAAAAAAAAAKDRRRIHYDKIRLPWAGSAAVMLRNNDGAAGGGGGSGSEQEERTTSKDEPLVLLYADTFRSILMRSSQRGDVVIDPTFGIILDK